tara:strand:+ start:328 stop:591 length:264 start_codon:yes stop_codon:yes gene_type:complete
MSVSERLDEIELKQTMSFQMFTKLNKEIRKIQNFIKKYCSNPDAPNACWPDYREPDYRGGFRKRKSRKKRRKKKHKTRKRKKSRRRR